MALLVANCPRCRAQRITLDAYADTPAGRTLKGNVKYEVFCVCRSCKQATIFMVVENDQRRYQRETTNYIIRPSTSADHFQVECPVSPADLDTAPPPEELPRDIEGAFGEATKCAAVGCYNAAGAMFRLCLNLATKGTKGKTLAARLETLCKEKQFSSELQELGSALRLDGNDAAHDGSLCREDVQDLEAFAGRFLTQLYTEPARVHAATERRKKRRFRSKSAGSASPLTG